MTSHEKEIERKEDFVETFLEKEQEQFWDTYQGKSFQKSLSTNTKE